MVGDQMTRNPDDSPATWITGSKLLSKIACVLIRMGRNEGSGSEDVFARTIRFLQSKISFDSVEMV